MPSISRRTLLAASGAAAISQTPLRAARAADKPRVTVITQWSAGSDGEAITALGKKFTESGCIW